MDIKNTRYTVIDVETTGSVRDGRMTEICIITIENMEITDVYSSLIQPDQHIPHTITALTGITNDMVKDAPRFRDIATIIEEKTRNTIFVAHNVNFDYGFLTKELGLLGHKFDRKKLCTIRLSRKLIPGLPSYSLGKLCRSIGISLQGAHRAEADTRATATLFLKLLNLDEAQEFAVFNNFLDKSSRQATLPPHISAEDFNKLPTTTGIYLFKNKAGAIIYVGKAKNIQARVLSHLYSKTQKSIDQCTATFHLDFVETGNELCALLLEADYIKKHSPIFNKAQKRPVNVFQIISYTNQLGIIQLAVGKTKNTRDSVMTLYTQIEGLETLSKTCKTFNLCPKYCALQLTNEPCSHYKIKDCKGICKGDEAIETYNDRVKKALEELEGQNETFIIKETGRTTNESAIVVVEKGAYKGFGYIENTIPITRIEEFAEHITPFENTYHTAKVVASFLKKDISKKTLITS